MVNLTCNARPLLLSAQASLDRGDVIAAGCQLREAARLYLHGECMAHDCLPSRRSGRGPRQLSYELHKAGILQSGMFGYMDWIITVGNKAAHCRLLQTSDVKHAIGLLRVFLNHSPYLVQPTAEGSLS
jgi:hypothetical protein